MFSKNQRKFTFRHFDFRQLETRDILEVIFIIIIIQPFRMDGYCRRARNYVDELAQRIIGQSNELILNEEGNRPR